MNCRGCLKEIGNQVLCTKCRKELFDGEKISLQLDFPSFNNDEDGVFMQNMQKISISGAQTKFSLKREKGKLVLTESGGQYILKPILIGPFKNPDQAPANEHLTMQIARQVFKIQTAACTIVFFNDGITPAYLTKRFDVKSDATHFQQEDFAQLAQLSESNIGEDYKYNYSYEEMANLIKEYIAAYPVELETFFKVVLFNYLFNNGDAHLKNFSVFRTEQGDYQLTPMYDLLNTKIHIPNDRDLALNKGLFKIDFETDSFSANGYHAYDDFFEFGIRIGINKGRVQKIISSCIDSEIQVLNLIEKSFLNNQTKQKYTTLYQDKLKALNYSYSRIKNNKE